MGGADRASRVGNLPAETTSFVGRRDSLAEVKRLLSVARMVTLTGVGGVGKTRLALRVAIDLRRAFADGVWLVDLSHLRDAALVPHTVRESLRVQDETGRGQTAVLCEYLAGRQLLLVLDNCEHLAETCATLAHTLLAAAPGLRVLATSRKRLRVDGEHIWQVPPLSVPDPQRPLPSSAVPHYPALTLFAERAAAVEPGFAVTDANRMQVVRVCHLLDGIPLAIELAAVRLRALSLEQLLTGLDDRYRLLAGGRRGGAPRHHTLQAAVEWSFDLCEPDERTLWARASVFAGGFDLSAAESICAGDGLAAQAIHDLVLGLVDKSVLIREQHADRVRFRLLETLRRYGRNKLREVGGEAAEAAVSRRHRDYYLRLAEQSEAEWFGPAQEEIFSRTRIEHPNLRVALDFCQGSSGETRTGLHLAGTLWFYWAGCGVLGEGRHWLDWALALDPRPGPERAKALWVNGYLATLRGECPAAVAMLEECREYATEAGDEIALAYSTHRLGCNSLVSDDLHRAQVLFEQAQARYVSLGEMNSNVMLAWIELAIAVLFLGDLDRAAVLCERARAVGRESGERWAYAYAIYVLALIALQRGDLDRAAEQARDCLRIKRTFNDLLGIVLAVEALAWTAAAQGTPHRAAALLGGAHQLWPPVGYPLFGSKHFEAPRHECEQAARRALGDEAYTAAFLTGTGFSAAETVAYALGTDPEPTRPARPLTPREQQVAELVATGLPNREIATRLVIGQRTVESHVENILQKLGFASRTDVAAWIADRPRAGS